MSTRGQFNTKNPTIKRILKEASELSTAPSPDYHAEPQETNLFEWHFTLRGPPAPSAYAGGIYHGRIILPPQYPLRPPSFRFLTPTGRFEVNREICLSISGHHEETWQPAWGVRTALVAIRSFMDTDAKGQLGGIECSKEARERMAKESPAWRCPACARTNGDIMKEREELVREVEATEGKRQEESIPEELRLAYRDELGKEHARDDEAGEDKPKAEASSLRSATSTIPSALLPAMSATGTPLPGRSAPSPRVARQAHAPTVTQLPQRSLDRSSALLDTCIYGILAALLFMVLKKFA
ncbi:ubiquitin-conjugating enzyme/RWD-like protein [Paraphoma chrysanthemicola]|uniref:Ubiquitin-conjugating enzyme/RWD-like protein n=1 Tax=Paraphoma chrysanthemicola TaxID=798071 RepID=A0A8K0RB24_9PLEO|nr:ubiquitin-conjugating enzyme/RWD-like protein [Paraphoma chrysanthemicola]